jgi:hypothetical protein
VNSDGWSSMLLLPSSRSSMLLTALIGKLQRPRLPRPSILFSWVAMSIAGACRSTCCRVSRWWYATVATFYKCLNHGYVLPLLFCFLSKI